MKKKIAFSSSSISNFHSIRATDVVELYSPPLLSIVNSVTVKLTKINYFLFFERICLKRFSTGRGYINSSMNLHLDQLHPSTFQEPQWRTQTTRSGFRLIKSSNHGWWGHVSKIFKVLLFPAQHLLRPGLHSQDTTTFYVLQAVWAST